jgi:hypothetical protein
VEDPGAVRQRLGFIQIVGAQEDGRVVRAADLADEVLHLELGARIEPGRRLVEEQEDGRRQERTRERDLLLHAAREILHRLALAVDWETDVLEDLGDARARRPRSHSVEPGGVAQVLRRRHFLEEGRFDGHAVHESPYRTRVREDVVAEDTRASAVVQEQGGEQANERGFAGAVWAQDRHALAALHRERDVAKRVHTPSAKPPFTAEEVLTELGNLYCSHSACSFE